MPNILLLRLLKNIVISIVMISAGIIFGISTKSIYVSSVPILFGLIAVAASLKMYYDWKTKKIIVITAVCIHKQPVLLGKTTYVFNCIGENSDKDFTFTLKDLKNNSFFVSGTYDFLFNNKNNMITEKNLIDYEISDIPNEQIQEILSHKEGS